MLPANFINAFMGPQVKNKINNTLNNGDVYKLINESTMDKLSGHADKKKLWADLLILATLNNDFYFIRTLAETQQGNVKILDSSDFQIAFDKGYSYWQTGCNALDELVFGVGKLFQTGFDKMKKGDTLTVYIENRVSKPPYRFPIQNNDICNFTTFIIKSDIDETMKTRLLLKLITSDTVKGNTGTLHEIVAYAIKNNLVKLLAELNKINGGNGKINFGIIKQDYEAAVGGDLKKDATFQVIPTSPPIVNLQTRMLVAGYLAALAAKNITTIINAAEQASRLLFSLAQYTIQTTNPNDPKKIIRLFSAAVNTAVGNIDIDDLIKVKFSPSPQ